ncbi:hypothetical protein AAMO2058_000507600 [Amorphochlora amoebiformis]
MATQDKNSSSPSPSPSLKPNSFPQLRAGLTIGMNLLLLLIGSGTMYGYNALRPVLVQDGAYAELCPVGKYACKDQKLSLNLAETLSFVISDIAYLPCGLFMDMLGMRVVSWFLFVLYAVGFGLMTAASELKIGVLYLSSLLFLGGVPSSAYMLGLGSAKMLWDHRYTHWVSAGVSLCYEVSPMFMYLIQLAVPRYVSFSAIMIAFGVVTSFFCICMGFTHMTLEEARNIDKTHGQMQSKEDSKEVWAHLTHPRYILQAIFLVVVNTKNQFYVATFADQIEYFSTKEEARLSNKLFDIGFFLSPIFATPFVIVFLGRFRNRYDKVFMLLWIMTMCHGLLNTFGKESLSCQLLAMVVFFVLKPLKWAAAAEFLHQPPYSLSMYGRLFGIVSVLCGVGSACIFPLTAMAYRYWNGSFFIPNLILTAVEGGVVIFPIYLYLEHKQKNRDHFREDYVPLNGDIIQTLAHSKTGEKSQLLSAMKQSMDADDQGQTGTCPPPDTCRSNDYEVESDFAAYQQSSEQRHHPMFINKPYRHSWDA